MSYPIDLDEYTEKQLRDELVRRESLQRKGRCDYCGRPNTSEWCKFPDRHRADRVGAVEFTGYEGDHS
jgi:hypothetical protein